MAETKAKAYPVVATKKGYSTGPREPGDKFDMLGTPDGKPPTGSWFKLNTSDKGKDAKSVESMA